jgi:hypothetical protein
LDKSTYIYEREKDLENKVKTALGSIIGRRLTDSESSQVASISLNCIQESQTATKGSRFNPGEEAVVQGLWKIWKINIFADPDIQTEWAKSSKRQITLDDIRGSKDLKKIIQDIIK